MNRSSDTMPPARIDQVLSFEGFHGRASCFRLRVYTAPSGVPVIVLTEIDENEGTSITNAAERCHWLAWARIGKPVPVRFVEHYPGRPGAGPRSLDTEHWDEVFFAGTSGDGPNVVENWRVGGQFMPAFWKPEWRRLTAAALRELITEEER
jgi:hypothetical protein